ncbi:MAG: hypothetical protein ACTSRA_17850 [Promethearchaeota archaeon]
MHRFNLHECSMCIKHFEMKLGNGLMPLKIVVNVNLTCSSWYAGFAPALFQRRRDRFMILTISS